MATPSRNDDAAHNIEWTPRACNAVADRIRPNGQQ
jgi:hypothetical protein